MALDMGLHVVETRHFGLWAPAKGKKPELLRACAMLVFAEIKQAEAFVEKVKDPQLGLLPAVAALGGVKATLRVQGADFRETTSRETRDLPTQLQEQTLPPQFRNYTWRPSWASHLQSYQISTP